MLKSEFELIIPQFEEWLNNKGYQIYPTIGQYEIMRFKKNNSSMNIIFFNKDGFITKMSGDSEILFKSFYEKPIEYEIKKIKFIHIKTEKPLHNQIIIKTPDITLLECYEIIKYNKNNDLEDFYWGILC